MSNPLIENPRGAYDSYRFSLIQTEHYLPAIQFGIEEARKNLKKIKEISNPNFENVIEALDHVSPTLDNAQNIFYNLYSSHATKDHQALAGEIDTISSKFSNEVSLDLDLFEQVKKVYQQKDKLNLNAEQKMLLDKTYKSFVRNGALLDAKKKEELKAIDEELAPLGSKFSENLLEEMNAYQLTFTDVKELAGLPESAIEAAALTAKEKGQDGKYIFTLQAPSYLPFMKYAKNREARHKLWLAYGTRCVEGSRSNQPIVQKIVELRHKRAALLGFKSHAEYVLDERMAKNPTTVLQFLEDMLQSAKPAAQKDIQEVKDFASKKDGLKDLMPWDFGFYSEQVMKEKYGFDDEVLRPYFSLDKVERGVFEVAKKLYQIDFVETKEIEKYHPDVKTYKVIDAKDNSFIGLFYADYFPRETKRSGAWMTEYKTQHYKKGVDQRPHVSIVCNFTKPTSTKPSLLTFDEVGTLFHEFGHSLHGLLSSVHYRSLAGTSVYWDFVELPSQFMENFLLEKEVLDLFAEHFETKEKIPTDLVARLKKSSNFQAGYACIRQLSFAFLDMAWHKDTSGLQEDPMRFEKDVLQKTQLLPSIAEVASSPSFSHIFAGGYSAGYYSYKWAEVLDADAFEAFKEQGLFNPKVAKSFRENILSKGGTEHPMDLYKKFRGRAPDPKALLRRDGLV